jgi:hypothetical protein
LLENKDTDEGDIFYVDFLFKENLATTVLRLRVFQDVALLLEIVFSYVTTLVYVLRSRDVDVPENYQP